MPTEAALLARLGGAMASEARAGILCALLGGTAPPRALQLTALGRRSLHSTFAIEAP